MYEVQVTMFNRASPMVFSRRSQLIFSLYFFCHRSRFNEHCNGVRWFWKATQDFHTLVWPLAGQHLVITDRASSWREFMVGDENSSSCWWSTIIPRKLGEFPNICWLRCEYLYQKKSFDINYDCSDSNVGLTMFRKVCLRWKLEKSVVVKHVASLTHYLPHCKL